MGVDYYVCAKCEEIFPDCGTFWTCENGHKLCSCCRNLKLEMNDVNEVLESSCPVCKPGGTKLEQLQKRIEELETEKEFLTKFLIGVVDGDNRITNEAVKYINANS